MGEKNSFDRYKSLVVLWMIVSVIWLIVGINFLRAKASSDDKAQETSALTINQEIEALSIENHDGLDFFIESPTLVVANSPSAVDAAAILSRALHVPVTMVTEEQSKASLEKRFAVKNFLVVSSTGEEGFHFSAPEVSDVAQVKNISTICDDACSRFAATVSDISVSEVDPSQYLDALTIDETIKKELLDLALPAQEDAEVVLSINSSNENTAKLLAANAQVAGYTVSESADLRANSILFEAVSKKGYEKVILAGDLYDAEKKDSYAAQLAAIESGYELPGGGLLIKNPEGGPQKYYIALYGAPGTSSLGVLGEQDVAETVERVKELTEEYAQVDPASEMVPTLEIITTVASQYPNPDNSYSTKTPIETLQPLVDAAGEAGIYVVLDLQPGRTHFLDQAKEYESLLRLPYVGLALDPEWRLEPDQVHLRQIGSVEASEVNEVGDWLAQLVRDNELPQKIFLLHQFNLKMLQDRDQIKSDYDELAVMIQMDGQGPQSTKLDTYSVLRRDAAETILFGWKNFYDEDSPGPLSPEETLALEPRPYFVSYQ